MKTIKISEKTHKQLTQLQSYIYIKENTKWNFDELISCAVAILMIDKKAHYEEK